MKKQYNYNLNDKEREYIESRYDFIKNTALKWYKKLNGLIELDDIIQLCSIGFIKSLKTYDKTKGYFEVHAKHKMNSEICHYLKCNKKYNNILYLEDFNVSKNKDNKGYIGYEELLPSNITEDKIIDNIINSNIRQKLITFIKDNFSNSNIDIIFSFLNGERQVDIAKKHNVSRQRIGQIINKFKVMSKEYLNELNFA